MVFIEYIAKVHETTGKAPVPTNCSADSKQQLTQSYHYRPELHFLHSNNGEPTGSSNGQGSSSSLRNVATSDSSQPSPYLYYAAHASPCPPIGIFPNENHSSGSCPVSNSHHGTIYSCQVNFLAIF